LLIQLLPHIGDLAGSKSKPLADRISGFNLLVAFLWLFVVVVGVFIASDAIDFMIPMTVASVAFLYMWRLFAKRLQGFTGDCLGATQQVCEVAFYLGLALSLA
jgi:adenosylcobinamide-GDP ribazoletransferase